MSQSARRQIHIRSSPITLFQESNQSQVGLHALSVHLDLGNPPYEFYELLHSCLCLTNLISALQKQT